MATEDKQERVQLWTPRGRFSYCFFAETDTGREFSDNAYKSDLIVTKAEFKEFGKPLEQAILKVGRDFHGKEFSLTSAKYNVPIKDLDKDNIENEAMKGCVLIRAKSGERKKRTKPALQPKFIGPRKVDDKWQTLSSDEVKAIKGGDWGKMQVAVYAYKGSKSVLPGVSLYLNAVQFWKVGEAFGQGLTKVLETAEELEIELDDTPNEETQESLNDNDADSII